MSEYIVKIKVQANSEEQVRELGSLVQNAVNSINRDDLIRLLAKVKQNPSIVKTALKFI